MTGDWRAVNNLSAHNGFVILMKFQMETAASVLWSIRKGNWMFSIDLKDTYFQIPIHLDFQPYLRFCRKGCVYQFRFLCFGLSTEPQAFTRGFTLILGWVCLLCYLDDWLVIAKLWSLLQHRNLVLQLYRDLGIVINWEKSDLHPSTCVHYLGMLIDMSHERKCSRQRLDCLAFRKWPLLSWPFRSLLHTWHQLLGHMASLERFLPRGHSHMSPLCGTSRITGSPWWTILPSRSLCCQSA